jgi:hypothetical protein
MKVHHGVLNKTFEQVLANPKVSWAHMTPVYWKHLMRWWKSFPREQLLVLSFEELSRPRETVEKVLAFLNIPPFEGWHFNEAINVASYAQQSATREALEWIISRFRPHNKKLYELLGRDMGWEKQWNEWMRACEGRDRCTLVYGNRTFTSCRDTGGDIFCWGGIENERKQKTGIPNR